MLPFGNNYCFDNIYLKKNDQIAWNSAVEFLRLWKTVFQFRNDRGGALFWSLTLFVSLVFLRCLTFFLWFWRSWNFKHKNTFKLLAKNICNTFVQAVCRCLNKQNNKQNIIFNCFPLTIGAGMTSQKNAILFRQKIIDIVFNLKS